jgi:hypothetical protein
MNIASPLLKGAAHAAEFSGDSVISVFKVAGDSIGVFADDRPDGSLGLLMSALSGVARRWRSPSF